LAVPDYAHLTLYLQAGREVGYQRVQTGLGNLWPQRMIIHHEFFHMLETQAGNPFQDPEWDALNPIGFHYGSGGVNALRSSANPPPKVDTSYVGGGFVSRYAMSAVEEDKAETFAYLMVRYGNVMTRARRDEVLASKVELLKQRLQTWCPEMGADWWAQLANTPVMITPHLSPQH
jgi:hypothetical protein